MALLFFLAGAANGATSSRLAIISELPRAAAASDILTGSFSKQTNVAVVERAELQRVLGEQSLAGPVSARALETGNILGADALLILEETAEQKNRFWMRRTPGDQVAISVGLTHSG